MKGNKLLLALCGLTLAACNYFQPRPAISSPTPTKIAPYIATSTAPYTSTAVSTPRPTYTMAPPTYTPTNSPLTIDAASYLPGVFVPIGSVFIHQGANAVGFWVNPGGNINGDPLPENQRGCDPDYEPVAKLPSVLDINGLNIPIDFRKGTLFLYGEPVFNAVGQADNPDPNWRDITKDHYQTGRFVGLYLLDIYSGRGFCIDNDAVLNGMD